MADKTHYFYVRGISKGVKNRVKSVAKQNGRSTNAELVKLIEKTYPPIIKEKKNEKIMADKPNDY